MKPYYEQDGITIYHGDCREIMPTLAASSIDMVMTDPPYGHNNNNGDLIHRWELACGREQSHVGGSDPRPIANDGIEANDLVRWMFAESKRVLKPECCCCCCCCGGGPDPQFARWSLWLDELLTFKQMIIWDKGPMGMGWHYRRSYETVLVGHKGQKCRWFDDTDRIENVLRPGNFNIRKIIPTADDHPTPKPWQLASFFISLHTERGDTVLDPFMGGGFALEGAHRTGRNFIGIELDESYCKMAVKKLHQGVLAI